ncbi:MAG: sigma-70 family RNA polymerase sigma factor [Planctomycetaceae bacterium]|nr:sigma-70 family RNA polymerase sigma factor [Planctomycetaceae bacterium]
MSNDENCDRHSTNDSLLSTCWTLIQGAAAGDCTAREEFARLYQPVILMFLKSRWAKNLNNFNLDDAMQDVFVDCFKINGALQRWEPGREGGFRGFLYGIVRNVARRHEENRQPVVPLDHDHEADHTGAETAFDRAWATSLMKQAARNMAEQAQNVDRNTTEQKAFESELNMDLAAQGRAMRRVTLLKKRFNQNQPIREIAIEWQVDAAWLHHEYATARQEFHAALMRVIAFHYPNTNQAEQAAICQSLLESLG